MEYSKFLESKIKRVEGSGFDPKGLNKNLFPFQKHIVETALRKGRYAIFADCGLGKTLMQLEWAKQVSEHTNKPVLILAPLAVSGQTINEGEKFGIPVQKLKSDVFGKGIYITNYEQIDNIETDQFSGVVLDESSILKNFTGKIRNKLDAAFKQTPYKLCCTATPSPNDANELGNHSQFLNILDAQDMRSKWFVRDEGMNNYRLKKHAISDFYAWVSSWACMLEKPSDIGFKNKGYDLPELSITEEIIQTNKRDNGKLFNDTAVNATDFNSELRKTMEARCNRVAEIVNKTDHQVIVWIKHNAEGDLLRSLIQDAVEVKGSDKSEVKEDRLLGFAKNEFRVLITKAKIAQFGLNYQNCNLQVFCSFDFSFEGLYQAIRRSYRFGQKNNVDIVLITTDTMVNVLDTVKRKQKDFKIMQSEMNKSINEKKYGLINEYDFREVRTDDYWLMKGDSVQEIKRIPDNSVDFSIFSPPFSALFTYSNYIHDMGNCEDHKEFFEQYNFLLKELYRIIKPGRLIACHTKDLAVYKNSSGYSGLYDFTGEHHRSVENAGFKYHSKVCIWTDPVLEMQRTKTQRLLYKQLRKDSSATGIGIPEYVTIFRKWEGNEEDWTPVTNKNTDNFPLDTWQRWASPVWMDIRRTDVLTNWRNGKGQGDEKHIAPLQLEVIKRCVALWTNKGETVFTPFLGIGSEAYQSVKMGRKAIGVELKDSYFDVAVSNVNSASLEKTQLTLSL